MCTCAQGKYLAEAALLSADTNRLRMAAHTLVGRCCHALGDFQSAQLNYAQVGVFCIRHVQERSWVWETHVYGTPGRGKRCRGLVIACLPAITRATIFHGTHSQRTRQEQECVHAGVLCRPSAWTPPSPWRTLARPRCTWLPVVKSQTWCQSWSWCSKRCQVRQRRVRLACGTGLHHPPLPTAC